MKKIMFFRTADAGQTGGDIKPQNKEVAAASGNTAPQKNDEQKDASLGSNDAAEELSQEIVAQRFGAEAQKKIKEFRVKADSLYLSCKTLPPCRETSLAITAFQNARQHCGIMLGEKGSKYPYPTMSDPAAKKIVGERTDKGEVLKDLFIENEPVLTIKKLREYAQDVITDFSIYMENSQYSSIIEFTAQNKVLAGLLDGKMWLGEHLALVATDK